MIIINLIFKNLKPKIKTQKNMTVKQHNKFGKELPTRTKRKKMVQQYVQKSD
jgi:hypothetical protein